MNSIESFRAEMRRAGLDWAGPICADGELHRIKVDGDHNRNSWYVLHDGPPMAGAFGCWKRGGLKESWCERKAKECAPEEWRRIQEVWRKADFERKQTEHERQQKAAKTAAWILSRSGVACQNHPYLTRKGVQQHGYLRMRNGSLVIPLRDANGQLHSLQFIDPKGEKRFLGGGKKAGCYFGVADKPSGPLAIAEGYATAATVHEATGFATWAAMDCANLLPVAKAARKKWPQREILLVADDDAATPGNPGLSKAREAAKAVNGVVAAPKFSNGHPGSDFNDLALGEGLTVVKTQIESALPLTSPCLLLRKREFNPDVVPGPPCVVLAVAGQCIATPGNLSTITAAAKAGKTAVLGAMAAAAMPHTRDADLLGFTSSNPDGKAMLWFDSEQSPDDFWHVVNRAIRRTGLTQKPSWFHSYHLTGLPYSEAWQCVLEAIRAGADAHGGIHSILLDGAADFVADVNDPAESNAYVATLHGLAIEHDCPVVAVIHFNPGTEKTRGHLGSQLERKAETNLKLEKDANGVTTVWADKNRRAPIPRDCGPCFKWGGDAGMHVSVQSQRETKDAEEKDRLAGSFSDVFLERPSMRYAELITTVKKVLTVSTKTAERKLSRAVTLGVLKKSVAGLYILTT